MNPKVIANKLLNLPKKSREYVVDNIAPQTFRRWVGQSIHQSKTFNLANKIEKVMTGGEQLSELALLELKEWRGNSCCE